MAKQEAGATPVANALRVRLVRLAYRYLGTVSDAEDIVQEACIKLLASKDVRDPEAWLARVVTNAALDRLRAIRARRETYIGPWLPEPVVESGESPSDRELDISFAVMRTLEALSPLERAAFFLHDLFGMDFDTIAEALGRSPSAARKLASRARQAVRASQPRFAASEADVERLLSAISEAVRSGEVDRLAALLTADVELVTDGGGKVIAALNVVSGPLPVALMLAGIARKQADVTWRLSPVRVNGGAGLLIGTESGIDSVLTIDLDSEGRIGAIYIVRNPEKLAHIAGVSTGLPLTPPSPPDIP